MAVTVTNNMTTVDVCDLATNFELFGTGASALAVNGDVLQEGAGSIACKVTGGMTNDDIGGVLFNNWLSTDITNKVIVLWVNTTNQMFSKANGGVRIVVEDGTGNQGFWFVGGSDTYKGGWQAFMVHGSTTFDGDSGTAPTLTDINKVGGAIRTTSDIMGGVKTFFLDIIREYNDTTHAITVDGGTTGDRGNWAEVAVADDSASLGIVQARGGSILVQGRIKLGNDGSTDSFFQSRGEVVIWQDLPVDNSKTTPTHFLDIVGGTGTNSVEIGEEIGSGATSIGINGGVMRAANKTNSGFYLNIDQSDTTVLMAGMQIDGCNEFDFGQANLTVISCGINNSGNILFNGAEMRESVVSDSTEAAGIGALVFRGGDPAADDFQNNLFVNNVHALEWEDNGPVSLDLENITFSNNTADLRFNHASGLLTVNIVEGGDSPTTSDGGAGGTITVVSAVTVTITVKSAATGNGIEGVKVFIDEDPVSVPPTLFSGTTNSSGVFTDTFNGSTPQNVTVRARLRGLIPVTILDTIVANTGLSVPITMTADAGADRRE